MYAPIKRIGSADSANNKLQTHRIGRQREAATAGNQARTKAAWCNLPEELAAMVVERCLPAEVNASTMVSVGPLRLISKAWRDEVDRKMGLPFLQKVANGAARALLFHTYQTPPTFTVKLAKLLHIAIGIGADADLRQGEWRHAKSWLATTTQLDLSNRSPLRWKSLLYPSPLLGREATFCASLSCLLAQAPHLTRLSLAGLYMQELARHMPIYARNTLTHLSLRNNDMDGETITQLPFSTMTSLKHLDLSYNLIGLCEAPWTLQIFRLPLETLKLSGNAFGVVPAAIRDQQGVILGQVPLESLSELKELDLRLQDWHPDDLRALRRRTSAKVLP